MYPAPKNIETDVYARLPDALRRSDQLSEWLRRRNVGPMHSFLEGPAFDRQGNLFCVDLAHGRIFKIAPDRTWSVFVEYDGEPNGLKIHRDGRIFVADRRHGVLVFDPVTAAYSPLTIQDQREPFSGVNDMTFASNGDLYVTDQGWSGYHDLSGAVWRIRPDGRRDLIFRGLAAPNGLVLNKQENVLHVSVTRTNQIMSFPLLPDAAGSPKARMFIQLSGSPTGPDGMAMDEDDNLVVVHAGFGTVWVFSAFGEPLYRIRSCAGLRTTNVAYGGPDGKTLFITEAEQGVILSARLPVAGRVIYGLS